MKILIFFLFAVSMSGQIITFDDDSLNSNQIINSPLAIEGLTFSSNKNFATNYGSYKNIDGVSLYFYFQDPSEDYITVANEVPFNFKSFQTYQVSEAATGLLVVTGFAGDTTKYKNVYDDLGSWETLYLDFIEIDSIKLSAMGDGVLMDFNFDNFVFDADFSDTNWISVEYIGHSDTAYSAESYRVYNEQGDSFIGDNVNYIEWPDTSLYFGIGPEVNNGYRIYYLVNLGIKTYLHFDTKIVQYREFSRLKDPAHKVEIK